jgi:hypothetical protein
LREFRSQGYLVRAVYYTPLIGWLDYNG